MVEQWVEGRAIDDLNLKGFNHPILAAEITSWREEVDNVVDARGATAEEEVSRRPLRVIASAAKQSISPRSK